MMYVVYQRMTPDGAYPVMLGVFLMKFDAKAFIDTQAGFASLTLEEVDGTWGYWNQIREKLIEQVYRTEEEY
jgi:hypothetical protein